ncbi:MAG: metallophosphoesterase [Candidatus Micrarchaeia archaeon]
MLRYLIMALLGVISLVLAYSVLVEPYNLQVTEHGFDLFDGSGHPLKAVLISDTQTAYDDPGYLSRVISVVNAEEPDIVFLAGDIVDGEPGGWSKLGQLSGLQAKHGVYAVLGNHDYRDWRCDDPTNDGYAENVTKALEGYGIGVLRNRHVDLDIDGRRFSLVGVDDLWACKSDLRGALSGVDMSRPKVILVHNNVAVRGHPLGNHTLVLSGHTHCGQVDVPFITDLLVDVLGFGKITGGARKLPDGNSVFVTCGVVPGGIRLFSRPEISVLYLD